KVRYMNQRWVRTLRLLGLIVYDLFCVVCILLVQCHTFSDLAFVNFFKYATKTTMNVIFSLSGYCFFFDYLVIKLTTTFSGQSIISTILDISKEVKIRKINSTKYYLIYVVMGTISALYSVAFIILLKP